MQNTDKELLELAAKAAGYCNWTLCSHGLFIETGHNRGDSGFYWNPLHDAGEALRLVVKLHLNVEVTEAYCSATHNELRAYFSEVPGDNPYAATRRAIVRAAAEIGKNMK